MKTFGRVRRTKSKRAAGSKSFHVPVPTPSDRPREDKPPIKRRRQLPPVAASGPGKKGGRTGFHVPVPTPSDRPRTDKPPRKRRPQLPPV